MHTDGVHATAVRPHLMYFSVEGKTVLVLEGLFSAIRLDQICAPCTFSSFLDMNSCEGEHSGIGLV